MIYVIYGVCDEIYLYTGMILAAYYKPSSQLVRDVPVWIILFTGIGIKQEHIQQYVFLSLVNQKKHPVKNLLLRYCFPIGICVCKVIEKIHIIRPDYVFRAPVICPRRI